MTAHPHSGRSAVAVTQYVIREQSHARRRSHRTEPRVSRIRRPWAHLLLITLSALVMALILLVLYSLFHAAAATLVDLPPAYVSTGWFVVAIAGLFFGLSARSGRAAWARLSLVAGTFSFVVAGTLVAGTAWSDAFPGTLPMETPWPVSGAWSGAAVSGTVGLAMAATGVAFLAIWYFLHRGPGSDKR